MPTATTNPATKSSEGIESHEGWRPAGYDDPRFVAGVQADIEALRGLTPNWDGYGAPAIDPEVIQAAKQFIARLPMNLAFRPQVVPTSNGSLQLEWHQGEKSLELEFESPRSIRYLQWNPAKGEEAEDSIAVKETERASDLIHWFMAGVCQ
jgi:hypothetical protein